MRCRSALPLTDVIDSMISLHLFRRIPVSLPAASKAAALALVLCTSPLAFALEKVHLQLKHTHQFQFAGYYAALEKGFYRDAGLDVRISEGADGGEPERRVIDGTADYGVGSSSVLLARMAGKPLVVLGVVFQHSPYVLLVRQRGTASSIQAVAPAASPSMPNVTGVRVSRHVISVVNCERAAYAESSAMSICALPVRWPLM